MNTQSKSRMVEITNKFIKGIRPKHIHRLVLRPQGFERIKKGIHHSLCLSGVLQLTRLSQLVKSVLPSGRGA